LNKFICQGMIVILTLTSANYLAHSVVLSGEFDHDESTCEVVDLWMDTINVMYWNDTAVRG
jgi:hypothetical protein